MRVTATVNGLSVRFKGVLPFISLLYRFFERQMTVAQFPALPTYLNIMRTTNKKVSMRNGRFYRRCQPFSR